MLVTILNSKADINGNRYWAVELSNLGLVIKTGTISCDNIDTRDLNDMNIEVCREELPIREFDRLTKKYEYIGCSWEDIKENLLKK